MKLLLFLLLPQRWVQTEPDVELKAIKEFGRELVQRNKTEMKEIQPTSALKLAVFGE